jgi:hypothetical protein
MTYEQAVQQDEDEQIQEALRAEDETWFDNLSCNARGMEMNVAVRWATDDDDYFADRNARAGELNVPVPPEILQAIWKWGIVRGSRL